jgi:hypothetical protein
MGIKTWRRSQAESNIKDIRLGLLKIQKELKNSFFFSNCAFKGTSKEMIFPLCLSETDRENIYTITYSIDLDEEAELKQFVRKEKRYLEDLGGEGEEEIKEILPLMKDIKFEYADVSNSPTEEIEWLDSWNGEVQNKLPSAVRVTLETDDTAEICSKTIFLQ